MNSKLNSNQIDTSTLEETLSGSCKDVLDIKYRLEIKKLASTLAYSKQLAGTGPTQRDYPGITHALSRFKANLQRRKKTSDILTSSRLMEIPEPARSILLSDIAYTFRDEIDDFTQIDFENVRHLELLNIAVDTSIAKVNRKQGRPINEALDEFFIGLKDLYESATGETAIATAHYNDEPKTDFEKLIYLGYQIIRPAQKYPSALKAYERAISRNS